MRHREQNVVEHVEDRDLAVHTDLSSRARRELRKNRPSGDLFLATWLLGDEPNKTRGNERDEHQIIAST